MTSVLLQWTPSGSSTSTGQAIQYKKSSSSTWITYGIVSSTTSSQLISSLLDNILYNFRVIDNCSFEGPTNSTMSNMINLVCPAITFTLTDSSITYSFSYDSTSDITGYNIDLYNSNTTVLLSTQTPGLSNPVNGVFTGLSASTSYAVRVNIVSGIYSKICPIYYPVTTGSGTIYFYTRTGDFQKNNCPASPVSTGSIVTYSQTYSSYVSVDDAKAIAMEDSAFPTSGQTYANTNGTCLTPPPSDAVGILVIDINNDHTLNLIGYCSSSGTTPFDNPVYTGNNFYPNDGTSPANCWALASDNVAGPSPTCRFEFNIARLLNTYPMATTFVFKIQGRNAGGGSISGAYSLKGAAAGSMTMTGSPGTYIPSTSGAPTISNPTFSGVTITSGADGTYGLGVGAVVMTFTYSVAAKTITRT